MAFLAASAIKKLASSGVGSGLVVKGKELFNKHKNEFAAHAKDVVSGATGTANKKFINKIGEFKNKLMNKIKINNKNNRKIKINNKINNKNNKKPISNGYKPLKVGNAASQLNMGTSPVLPM